MKKPTPAKPAIRYTVVDKDGEIVSHLCRHKFHPEQLLEDHTEPGYRLAKFKLVEVPENE